MGTTVTFTILFFYENLLFSVETTPYWPLMLTGLRVKQRDIGHSKLNTNESIWNFVTVIVTKILTKHETIYRWDISILWLKFLFSFLFEQNFLTNTFGHLSDSQTDFWNQPVMNFYSKK